MREHEPSLKHYQPEKTMAETEIQLHTPGEDDSTAAAPAPAAPKRARTAAAPAPAAEPSAEPAGPEDRTAPAPPAARADDGQAAYIAKLEADNAQLTAMIVMLQEQLANVQEPNVPPPPKELRLIGDDWSNRTSAEAREAGVRKTVLCSDGYYVPPPAV